MGVSITTALSCFSNYWQLELDLNYCRHDAHINLNSFSSVHEALHEWLCAGMLLCLRM